MRSLLALLAVCTALLLTACDDESGTEEPAAAAAPVATEAKSTPGHPRLIVNEGDLGRLRSWAAPSNPVFQKGLLPLANNAKRLMDGGTVPEKDSGAYNYEQYPTEQYAELFAFMSLVHPQAKARSDYGRRARKLLMYVVDQAVKGPKADTPFRDPGFSVVDRSRWQGEAFPLTVDWAYPYFSKVDKGKLRKLFLRWAKEQYRGYPFDIWTGPRPLPSSKPNDPALISNVHNVRYALNNYYLAHARNLGLMAMALDPGDDPGNQLRGQLKQVVGSWLFVIDNALKTQAKGGLSPEGFEYGPDAVGRIAQLLVALRTAGPNGDASPVAKIDANPFWGEAVKAYLHSLPPVPTRPKGDQAYQGQIWQAASFGDEESYWALDPITFFGPMAVDAAARGDTATVNAARWVATNVPAGGKDALLDRIGNTDQLYGSIWYFLTLDPTAPEPTDPRHGMDTRFVATSLNRTLARTCWCASGRLFTHKLSYNTIDHQVGDGNDFGFFRNGEWLTKQRSGYDSQQTEALNIVTIANDRPIHTTKGEYPRFIWDNGGQWILVPAGDPTLVSRSFGPGFAAITGDATNLYNSTYEKSLGVAHSSRSIVWLEPDLIVVYDRAVTKATGRFKRFWLQAPAKPSIAGRLATVATPKGQRLFSTTLLPENAVLTASKHHPSLGAPAVGEPMGFRLRVEAPGGPQDVRFLHVVQGADGGASAAPTQRVRSSAGAVYDGAVVAGQAVLFPSGLRGGPTTIDLPAGLTRILVTGLTPGAGYTASVQTNGATATLTVADGGPATADDGGTLAVAP